MPASKFSKTKNYPTSIAFMTTELVKNIIEIAPEISQTCPKINLRSIYKNATRLQEFYDCKFLPWLTETISLSLTNPNITEINQKTISSQFYKVFPASSQTCYRVLFQECNNFQEIKQLLTNDYTQNHRREIKQRFLTMIKLDFTTFQELFRDLFYYALLFEVTKGVVASEDAALRRTKKQFLISLGNVAHSKNSVKEKEAQKRISKRVLNDVGHNGSGLSYDEILLKFKSLENDLKFAEKYKTEYNQTAPIARKVKIIMVIGFFLGFVAFLLQLAGTVGSDWFKIEVYDNTRLINETMKLHSSSNSIFKPASNQFYLNLHKISIEETRSHSRKHQTFTSLQKSSLMLMIIVECGKTEKIYQHFVNHEKLTNRDRRTQMIPKSRK